MISIRSVAFLVYQPCHRNDDFCFNPHKPRKCCLSYVQGWDIAPEQLQICRSSLDGSEVLLGSGQFGKVLFSLLFCPCQTEALGRSTAWLAGARNDGQESGTEVSMSRTANTAQCRRVTVVLQ